MTGATTISRTTLSIRKWVLQRFNRNVVVHNLQFITEDYFYSTQTLQQLFTIDIKTEIIDKSFNMSSNEAWVES